MSFPVSFDHLMFGGRSDLVALTTTIGQRLGVTPSPGGRHATGGTHNTLLNLGGDRRYLELIAADPEGDPTAARGRRIAALPAPRNIAWAIAVDDLDDAVARARARGYDPGPIEPLQRQRPDGTWLRWRLAWASPDVFLGVVPFLIEWGTTPHPATDLGAGCQLLGLRAEHPEPETPRAALAALAVDLAVTHGPGAALVARIETPHGIVELR